MPDSFVLTGPGAGTQVEFASYSGAPDFGQKDLLKAVYLESPFTEGALSHEQTGPRKMAFPLILRGSQAISNLSLYDQESLFRKLARPGAVLDLKPQGATTAVRFDVLSGRYEFDYHVAHNREGIRLGTLKLETRPFGYWPTWILLASVASVGPSGIAITGSILGDAPAQARLVYQPTSQGFNNPDFLAWSLAARASFVPLIRVASTTFSGDTLIVATYRPSANTAAFETATSMQLQLASPGPTYYRLIAHPRIPTALEPAYRGRFRCYAALVDNAHYFTISVDVSETIHGPMASAGQVATVYNFYGADGQMLLDLGEITLPPAASGQQQSPFVRFWGKPATTNHLGVATPTLDWGGLYLLPVDGESGVMPRGLNVFATGPYAQATFLGLDLDAAARRAVLRGYAADLDSLEPFGNAYRTYRGGLPHVGASTRVLHLLHGVGNATNAETVGPGVKGGVQSAAVSLQYRPRFQFMRGL